MAQLLAGKIAIVTGGAHGIGRATVDLFVQEGARVVIGDINDELGEQAAKELGGGVRFKHCDVAKPAEMEALVNYAVSEFGGLHVMMNNAGLSESNFGRFVDADFSQFEQGHRPGGGLPRQRPLGADHRHRPARRRGLDLWRSGEPEEITEARAAALAET